MKYAHIVGVAAVAAAAPALTQQEPPIYEPSQVKIVRDTKGIPHVFAETAEGAYRGLGYACAQDRFLQMSWVRMIIYGEVSSILGKDKDPMEGDNIHLEHDLRMRLFAYRELAEMLKAEMDPETLALLEAYADGVNLYVFGVTDPPPQMPPTADLHPLFEDPPSGEGLPVEPWRAEDSIAVWLRVARFFTAAEPFGEIAAVHDLECLLGDSAACEGGILPPGAPMTLPEAIDCLSGVRVFDDEAAAVPQDDFDEDALDRICDFLSQYSVAGSYAGHYIDPDFEMSQAWAIPAIESDTQNALLVGDPRIPLRVPNVIWEAHMTCEDFEVRGGAFPGSPNFLFGSNRNVAWSVTAMGMDQADLFEVELQPASFPPAYVVDGSPVPFETISTGTIEIENAMCDGMSSIPIAVRGTIWGPVVTDVPEALEEAPCQIALSNRILDGEVYAARWVPWHLLENPLVDTSVTPNVAYSDSAYGFRRMYEAETEADFRAALAGWIVPSVNCIFATKDGVAGYQAVGALPLRDASAVLGGTAAQDGSTTQSMWQTIVPTDILPWVIYPNPNRIGNSIPNSDPPRNYVFSGNHLPVGEWYPIPFVNKGGHGHRSAHLQEWLETHVDGNGTNLTDATAIEMGHYDAMLIMARDAALLGREVRDNPIYGPPPPLSTDAELGLAMLEEWAEDSAHSGANAAQLLDAYGDDWAAACFLARETGRGFSFRGETCLEDQGDVPKVLLETYGNAEAGLHYFLRTMREKLAGSQPFDCDEIAVIDGILAGGWRKAQGLKACSDDCVTKWSTPFRNSLSPQRRQWIDLEGFSLAEAFGSSYPDISVGPLRAVYNDSLLAQTQNVYVLMAELASTVTSSTIRSLQPIGAQEPLANLGASHDDDRLADWESFPQVLRTWEFDQATLEAAAESITILLGP